MGHNVIQNSRRLGQTLCSLVLTSAALVSLSANALPRPGAGVRVDAELNLNFGTENVNSDSIFLTDKDGFNTVNEIIGTKIKIRPDRKTTYIFDAYMLKFDDGVFNTDGSFHTESEYDVTYNQLFVAHRFAGNMKVTVGRQRILWGHGLAYVPSDFINPPLDPSGLDLTNAKGVDSVSLDWFTAGNSYTLLLNLDNSAERTGIGAKWTNNTIDGFDFNVVYYNSEETGNAAAISFSGDPLVFTGESKGELSTTVNIAMRERSQYARPTTQTFVGDAFSDPTGMGAISNSITYPAPGEVKDDKGNWLTYLVGMSYELLESHLTFRGEYYYIQDAYSKDTLRDIYGALDDPASPQGLLSANWLNSLAYGRNQHRYFAFTLSQDALTEGSGNQFTDNFGYSVSLTRGLEDHSTLGSINLNSRYFENAEITLDILLPFGDDDSEFGSMSFNWRADIGVNISF
ncbi:hypothetical protein [Alteromonas sp. a30]|uniref:hypothetical protein n=1 Tax=Alteromonas sp. a30 TaxID=2730917 RepID=UPI00227E0270|nr:hypothetical protein [Alteromonas sp. a30]MCY7295219.1 hypothetical protein [Alteromonas sp. a30]